MPKARLGVLPTVYTSSKRTTELHSSRLQSGFSLLPESQRREREFVVDSGVSMHMARRMRVILGAHGAPVQMYVVSS